MTDHQVVDTASEMDEAIGAGRLAICEDGMLVACCEQVDVFVESSSSITAGARFTVAAIEFSKHVNLMNAEIDLVFGPYFLDLARRNGVTYTSCDGDQHTVLKNVIDDMILSGVSSSSWRVTSRVFSTGRPTPSGSSPRRTSVAWITRCAPPTLTGPSSASRWR